MKFYYSQWLRLCFKRLLKMPVFWGILIVFPVACIFFSVTERQENEGISVAVYIETAQPGNEGFLNTLSHTLITKDGLFSFGLYEDARSLEAAVISRRAECGYIIPGNLKTLIDQGKKRSLISCVAAPETVMDPVINEVIFQCLFQCYAPEILNTYLENAKELPLQIFEDKSVDWRSVFQRRLTDGSTFEFQYNMEPGQVISDNLGLLKEICRGMMALMMALGGLSGCYSILEDREKHFYLKACRPARQFTAWLAIAAAVVCSSVSMLVGMIGSGFYENFLSELVRTGAFGLLVWGYMNFVLAVVTRRFCLHGTAIILFVMGIVTVFVHVVPAIVPASIQWLCRLFPMWYYLSSGPMEMSLLGIILGMMGFVAEFEKK